MGLVFRAGTFAAALLALAGSQARAETLQDAIALAYDTNPTLQAQRAQVRFTDENLVQARAGYRPTATGQASLNYSMFSGRNILSGIFGPPVQIHQPGQAQTSSALVIQLNQPVFTGGRATANVTAAEGDILAQRETLRQTENTVMVTVIQAYVDVRRDQESLVIRGENLDVLKKQVSDTRARFAVGEVTKTDVAQAEASLAAAQSLYSNAQAQLGVSRANYAEVVGQMPTDLEPQPPLVLPISVEQAFDIAQENSPTLRAADYNQQAAHARVAEAKSLQRPSVSLQATLGYNGFPVTPFDRRNESSSITAAAVYTQPLFAGGTNLSQIRQALERENFFKIQLEGQRRAVIQNISQAWNQLIAARATIAASQEQVRAARIAFEGAQQEQAVGLRTTLEVLNAEEVLRDAELQLVAARRNEYLAAATVLQQMGVLEAHNLAPDLPNDPTSHTFRRLAHAPGYVPWEEGVKALDQIGGGPRIQQRPPAVDDPLITAPRAEEPAPAKTSAAVSAPSHPASVDSGTGPAQDAVHGAGVPAPVDASSGGSTAAEAEEGDRPVGRARRRSRAGAESHIGSESAPDDVAIPGTPSAAKPPPHIFTPPADPSATPK